MQVDLIGAAGGTVDMYCETIGQLGRASLVEEGIANLLRGQTTICQVTTSNSTLARTVCR